jgi:hypothetical protein
MFLLLLLEGREGVLVRDALHRSSGDTSEFSEKKNLRNIFDRLQKINENLISSSNNNYVFLKFCSIWLITIWTIYSFTYFVKSKHLSKNPPLNFRPPTSNQVFLVYLAIELSFSESIL